MDVFLPRHQCGFRKGYSTQQCLLAILGKWRSAVDNKKTFGALLTDLSKAFDCLLHKLCLAKLLAYGFSIPALRLVYSYLKNRKQRTKINSAYSCWEEIIFGVPQGSILGPLLFNIFLYDLFYMISNTDFASYADNNTPYVSADAIDEVVKRQETASVKLFKWFADSQMKANQDKCHLIVGKNENVSLHIAPFQNKNTNCEKLLGIKVDSRLNFNEDLDGIIKKASHRINALSRITSFKNIAKRRILTNSFFNSQFDYCPLVWMFHSPSINNKINCLYERVLHIVYSDFKSSFENLLEKDETFSIHVNNLLKLPTEMFKISKNFSIPLMSELFHQKVNHYDLRNPYEFSVPNFNSIFHGKGSISYLGPLI